MCDPQGLAEPFAPACFATWIGLDDNRLVDARDIIGLSGSDTGTDVYLRNGLILATQTLRVDIEQRMVAALGKGVSPCAG